MLGVVIVVGVIFGLSWGFYAAARSMARIELSFGQAVGIMFTAKLASRAIGLLLPDLDVAPRAGATLLLYIVILAGGLMLTAKAPPVRALVLAVVFTLLTFVAMMALAFAGVFDVPRTK